MPWTDSDRILPIGETGWPRATSNPALANTLQLIADKGADAYYKGPVAEKLVTLSNQVGGLFTLVGLVMGAPIVATWIAHGLGSLADERLAVVAASVIIVGIQIFFSSFLLSILGLRRR